MAAGRQLGRRHRLADSRGRTNLELCISETGNHWIGKGTGTNRFLYWRVFVSEFEQALPLCAVNCHSEKGHLEILKPSAEDWACLWAIHDGIGVRFYVSLIEVFDFWMVYLN